MYNTNIVCGSRRNRRPEPWAAASTATSLCTRSATANFQTNNL